MNDDKVKIKIDIAGESFILLVPYGRQEDARQTETEVNRMFEAWRRRFPEKGDRELLAMIAFRYAERYEALVKEQEEARTEAANLSDRLNVILS